jgi:hypothetical protein
MAVLALALVGVSVGCHSSSSAESGGSEGVIDRSPEPAASGVRAPGTARGRQGPSRQEQVMVEDWDWGRDEIVDLDVTGDPQLNQFGYQSPRLTFRTPPPERAWLAQAERERQQRERRRDQRRRDESDDPELGTILELQVLRWRLTCTRNRPAVRV